MRTHPHQRSTVRGRVLAGTTLPVRVGAITVLASLALVACTPDANKTGGHNQTGDADGAASLSCSATLVTMTKLVEEHRTCSVDADCTILGSWCIFTGRGNCAGQFYVNVSIGVDAFRALDNSLTQMNCTDAADGICGTCGLGAPMTPACVEGRCGAVP